MKKGEILKLLSGRLDTLLLLKDHANKTYDEVTVTYFSACVEELSRTIEIITKYLD